MGANVWQRDTTGSGQGTSFKTGSAAGPHPARLGKRKLVWTKDQHDQPAIPSVSTPQPVTQRGGLPPSSSSRQYDHFEKTARLTESLKVPHNGYHRGPTAPQQWRHEDRGPLLAETRQQQSGAASQDPAAVLEQRKKDAELAELKRRIQQYEAQAEAQAAELKVCHTLLAYGHVRPLFMRRIISHLRLRVQLTKISPDVWCAAKLCCAPSTQDVCCRCSVIRWVCWL